MNRYRVIGTLIAFALLAAALAAKYFAGGNSSLPMLVLLSAGGVDPCGG